MKEKQKRRILIAGCGYIGETLADSMHSAGWEVIALTNSEGSAIKLRVEKAYRIEAVSISNREAVQSFAADEHRFDVAVHCASSARGGGAASYRQVYVEGCRNLVEILQPVRLLYTSSTSVYPQVDGELIDEESRAFPTAETGRILREAEDIVLAAGGTVVRLAGLYGPGRSILLRTFLEGNASIDFREANPTPDGRWINQVHRDDVASALSHLISRRDSIEREIYNLCDSKPMTQRDVYRVMSKMFGKPEPPTLAANPNKKRGWTNKRVSNGKLTATGWKPTYSNYQSALENDHRISESIQFQVVERSEHRIAISRDDCVFVFDKDGVLFNSEPVKLAAFESLFEAFPEHAERIRQYNRTNVGAPRPEKLEYIFSEVFGYDSEEVALKRDEFLERAAELVGRLLPEVPLTVGAESLLRESPCPKFLCSAAPAQEVEDQLAHHNLADLFKDTFADPNKKADVLKKLGAAFPGRKLVFWGDTIRDYDAAKAAGVYFVGVERYDRIKVFDDTSVPIIQDFSGGCGIEEALALQST